MEDGSDGLSVARTGEQFAHSDVTAAPATLSLRLKKLRRAGFIDLRQEAHITYANNLEDIAAVAAAMPPASRVLRWHPPAAEPAPARVPRP